MRRASALVGLLGAVTLTVAAAAAPAPTRRPEDTSEVLPHREMPPDMDTGQPSPWLRWMLHPLKRGMWIRLPIMDTDPNRGVTVGVMPIWVLKESNGDRIREIHAPSLTYNKNFVVTPTYRYYLYPKDDAALAMRGSIGKYEREAMGHYEDQSFRGTDVDVLLRVQYNMDAGPRFFGIGPDTPQDGETNYKEDYLIIRSGAGIPLLKDSGWRVHFNDKLLFQKVGNGPLKGLKGFEDTYPQFATEHRHQSHELRFAIDYDSRNHPVTTSEGAFAQAYNEHSIRDFVSEYDYNRTGVDSRYFYRWLTERKIVTAVGVKAEALSGAAPFWLLPRLGGKYSLRAYGEGRYVDRSMAAANIEQRITFFEAKMGGVVTEFEVAPFAGIGTVADTPKRMSARYGRPVFGAAIRAVAPPQVVGSVDVGVGQEGVSVFMDINYSF